jgi:hypothetical protein
VDNYGEYCGGEHSKMLQMCRWEAGFQRTVTPKELQTVLKMNAQAGQN